MNGSNSHPIPAPRFTLVGELAWYGGLLLATVGPGLVLAASAMAVESEDDSSWWAGTIAPIGACLGAFPLGIWIRRRMLG